MSINDYNNNNENKSSPKDLNQNLFTFMVRVKVTDTMHHWL